MLKSGLWCMSGPSAGCNPFHRTAGISIIKQRYERLRFDYDWMICVLKPPDNRSLNYICAVIRRYPRPRFTLRR